VFFDEITQYPKGVSGDCLRYMSENVRLLATALSHLWPPNGRVHLRAERSAARQVQRGVSRANAIVKTILTSRPT
jgi:hypothetical protein